MEITKVKCLTNATHHRFSAVPITTLKEQGAAFKALSSLFLLLCEIAGYNGYAACDHLSL